MLLFGRSRPEARFAGGLTAPAPPRFRQLLGTARVAGRLAYPGRSYAGTLFAEGACYGAPGKTLIFGFYLTNGSIVR